jgi:hypothetical protein
LPRDSSLRRGKLGFAKLPERPERFNGLIYKDFNGAKTSRNNPR